MKKKEILMWAALILFALAAGIGTNIAKIDYWQNKFDYQTAINEGQSRKIKELEKEIRLLKTDVHILMYGFEDSDEEADNSR